jgi:translation initiation factor 2 alpha subunit (eIF-2alpha)
VSIAAQKKPKDEDEIRAINADREEKYGHPADIFKKTAIIWTGILEDKLKTPIEAHEVGLMMAGHKIAREAQNPNVVVDNLDDTKGYINTVSMVYERR